MTIKTRTTTKPAAKPAAKTVKKTAPAAKKPATEAVMAAPQMQVQPEQSEQPITGRGVFAVRTLGDAVSVEAAFLAEDGNVLRLPAVFPNREYALAQIDELRELVNRHFDELAAAASR